MHHHSLRIPQLPGREPHIDVLAPAFVVSLDRQDIVGIRDDGLPALRYSGSGCAGSTFAAQRVISGAFLISQPSTIEIEEMTAINDTVL